MEFAPCGSHPCPARWELAGDWSETDAVSMAEKYLYIEVAPGPPGSVTIANDIRYSSNV